MQKLIRLVIAACVAALILPAGAQLSSSPSIQELRVSPGAPRKFVLRYANHGKAPLHCTLTANDMGMSLDGLMVESNLAHRGCGKWITFSPKEFVLAPGQQRDITATLRAPAGSGGGYYASVECAAKPERAGKRTSISIEFVQRVSSAILVASTGARPKLALKVARVEMLAPRQPGAQWQSRVTIQNDGNIHFRVAGVATLLGANGSVISRSKLAVGRGYIFAGLPRRFTSTLGARIRDGLYTLKVDIAGPGNVRAGGSETFVVLDGKAKAGKPDAATLAYLKSSAPFLAIDKPRVHYILPRGGRHTDTIAVQNLSSTTVKIVPRKLNWDLDANADLRFEAGALANGRGASGHFAVSPSSLTLSPGQRGSFRITSAMPKDASGEYYGAIYFAKEGEAVPRDPKIVRERCSVLTMLAKGTETRTVKPAFFKFADHGDNQSAWITVASTANALVELSGRIQILRGAAVAVNNLSFAGPGTVLVPGSKAAFEVPLKTPLARGVYTIRIFVKVTPGDKEYSAQGKFTIK